MVVLAVGIMEDREGHPDGERSFGWLAGVELCLDRGWLRIKIVGFDCMFCFA